MSARRWIERALSSVSLMCMAAGCSDATPRRADAGPSTKDADAAQKDAAAPDANVPVVCRLAQADVLRVSAWPGAGLQLGLTLRDAEGAPLEKPTQAKLTLHTARGDALSPKLGAAPVQAGITALLLVPAADAAEDAQRHASAVALVEALPADERIAVWIAEPELPLAAELTAQRAHVLERIAQVRPSAAQAPDAAALARLVRRVQGLEQPWGALQRNLVVVGAPVARAEAPCLGDQRVTQHALLAAAAGGGALDAAQNVSSWGKRASPKQAASALAEHIARLRAATVLLGACEVPAAGEALSLSVDGDARELLVPEAPDDLADHKCDAAAAAADDYPLGERIELVMTAAETKMHDAYATAENETDFPLQIVIGHAAPVVAAAHFRGQTSLKCDRKSYSINLQGGAPRRLFARDGDDELYLLSMCKESHFHRQVLANRILAALGVFPLQQRYVELRVNGKSRGVYLLLRKPTEVLLGSGVGVQTVVRRRFDPDDKPAEVRFPEDPAAAAKALAQYDALSKLIDSAPVGARYALLGEHMDIDAYLRWDAFHTYFQNGDYVDETFFAASNEAHGAGQSWYFHNIAWDSDDLFKGCHHGGQFAYSDPHGLLYCAEGDLDRALVDDPDLYAHFLDALDAIMEVWTPERVEQELLSVREELFAVLDDDAVCAVSGEGAAVTPAVGSCDTLRAAIEEQMAALVGLLRSRAATLRSGIDAARGMP